MKSHGKPSARPPVESVRVRGTMPALIYKQYVKKNPLTGSLYYSEILVMLANAWDRAPESADPTWDVIAFKFFVIAHRDIF